MKKLLLMFLIFMSNTSYSQLPYFPPLTGNAWDTLSPSALNWCQPQIDSLYDFLQTRNTKGFIILKDGKIVLEKYFGTFTVDSIHYWASAGKSLTATLVGIAQENNLLDINDSVSHYLGAGWTTSPPGKEGLITIRHLLTMTSGLDDAPSLPCANEDTSSGCLQYLADAGTRWAYHTGAYRKLQAVIANASGTTYNLYSNQVLGIHIGMTGLWYDGVFYSKPRVMARFGLLTLNKGVWNTDTLLYDPSYYNSMTNTSQLLNESYGYLWWINGQNSFMVPSLQFVFTGPMLSNAPYDMFAALGKNDQKIYVVPSQNMVVVRVGNAAYSTAAALTVFDNELWGKIDSLDFCPTGLVTFSKNESVFVYTDQVNQSLSIDLKPEDIAMLKIFSVDGKIVLEKEISGRVNNISLSAIKSGIYILHVDGRGFHYRNKIMQLH